MPSNQAAREYARAIMEYAPEQSEAVISLFRKIIAERAREPRYNRVLLHPAIPLSDKLATIIGLGGKQIPHVVEKILSDLLIHHAIALLPSIIDNLVKMQQELGGVQQAEVFSPDALTDEKKSRISSAIGSATGKKAEVTFTIDPELIAGYKVKIGDNVYDNSVRRQLELISDQLTAATRL